MGLYGKITRARGLVASRAFFVVQGNLMNRKNLQHWRIICRDIDGRICDILQRGYPLDWNWRACRDDLMQFVEGGYWYSVTFERTPEEEI